MFTMTVGPAPRPITTGTPSAYRDAALDVEEHRSLYEWQGLDERKDQEILKTAWHLHGWPWPQRAQCGRPLHPDHQQLLSVNAIAWDARGQQRQHLLYQHQDGSTFTADGNEAGIVGLESLTFWWKIP